MTRDLSDRVDCDDLDWPWQVISAVSSSKANVSQKIIQISLR